MTIADAEKMSSRKPLDVGSQNVLVLIHFIWIVRVVANPCCEGKLAHTILAFSELLLHNFVGLLSHRGNATTRVLRLSQFLSPDDSLLILAVLLLLLVCSHLELLLRTRWRRVNAQSCRRETCRTTRLNGLSLILDKAWFDLRILRLLVIVLFLGTLKGLWLRIPGVNNFSPILTGLTTKLPSQLRIFLLSQSIIFSNLLILSPITSRHNLSVFSHLLLIPILFAGIRIKVQGLLLDILHLVLREVVALVNPIVRRFTILLTLVSIKLLRALLELNLVISRPAQMPLVVSSLCRRRWHLASVLSRIRGQSILTRR